MHQRQVKAWSRELILEFADDFEDDDEEGDKEEENDENEAKDLEIKGPLNHLFPLMLK